MNIAFENYEENTFRSATEAEWTRMNARQRAEFADFTTFFHFKKAEKEGRVKIHGQATSK